jgi:hypothetical protein
MLAQGAWWSSATCETPEPDGPSAPGQCRLREHLAAHPTIGVGCDKIGGTSGGPWVIVLSSFGGATNFLNGNNSYRYTGPNPPANLRLYSPYFTTGAVNLRDAAQAIVVP